MKAFVVWVAIMAALVSVIVLSTGCATAAKTKPVAAKPLPPPVLTHPGQTPVELTRVSKGLDWVIVIAVIGLGVGVGLFFFLPVAHNLSVAIAGTAGAIEGSALITKVSLWFIPWIAAGLGVLALGFLIYEVVRNRKRAEAAWNKFFNGVFTTDKPVTPITPSVAVGPVAGAPVAVQLTPN